MWREGQGKGLFGTIRAHSVSSKPQGTGRVDPNPSGVKRMSSECGHGGNKSRASLEMLVSSQQEGGMPMGRSLQPR